MSGAVWIAGSFNSLAVEHRLGVVSEPVYHSLLRAGLTSVSVVSVACFLGAIGGSALGEVWGPMGFLVGVAAFGLGLRQLLTASILRQQRQGVLARGRLIQGVTNAVLIVASVFTPVPGYLGLSLAWAASIFFGLVPLIFSADFRIRGLGRPRGWDRAQLWREVKLLPVSQAMAGSVASLPLIVLPGLGNDSISGAWALVSRFLTPMVNTAYTTLQPLYYGGAAEILREDRREEFKRFHARWVALLFVGSLPVLAFFVVCIQWLIPLLGDSWDVAKLVVVPGCVYFTSGFICLPISHTLVLLGAGERAVLVDGRALPALPDAVPRRGHPRGRWGAAVVGDHRRNLLRPDRDAPAGPRQPRRGGVVGGVAAEASATIAPPPSRLFLMRKSALTSCHVAVVV